MEFADDLAERVSGCVWRARVNYFFAYAMLAVAVAASAASSLAVAADIAWPKEAKAILAALPGILALAAGTFKLEKRADWWWTKHHELDALQRGLKVEGRSEADVSRDLSRLIRELELKWPGFGGTPSKDAA